MLPLSDAGCVAAHPQLPAVVTAELICHASVYRLPALRAAPDDDLLRASMTDHLSSLPGFNNIPYIVDVVRLPIPTPHFAVNTYSLQLGAAL